MYEITAWNPTENLPQVLLDAVKRIQLCELVDPERKLTILSRYTVHSTYVLMLFFTIKPQFLTSNYFSTNVFSILTSTESSH